MYADYERDLIAAITINSKHTHGKLLLSLILKEKLEQEQMLNDYYETLGIERFDGIGCNDTVPP